MSSLRKKLPNGWAPFDPDEQLQPRSQEITLGTRLEQLGL